MLVGVRSLRTVNFEVLVDTLGPSIMDSQRYTITPQSLAVPAPHLLTKHSLTACWGYRTKLGYPALILILCNRDAVFKERLLLAVENGERD